MQVEHTRTYLVSEVAGHFEVSVATIYRAIESGQLDALKLGTPGEARCGWPGAAVLAYRQGVRTRVGGGWSMGCARQARRVRGERPRDRALLYSCVSWRDTGTQVVRSGFAPPNCTGACGVSAVPSSTCRSERASHPTRRSSWRWPDSPR